MRPQVSPLQSFIAASRHLSGQVWDACYLPTGKVRLRKVKKCAYNCVHNVGAKILSGSKACSDISTEIESTTYLLPKYETKAYP